MQIMNYWITVHWPPRTNDSNHDMNGVFVPDRRQEAGKDLEIGDKILIFESQTGRTEIYKDLDGRIHHSPCRIGRRGIVAIVEAVTPLRNDPNTEITKYANGTEILWSWYAETKTIRDSGFVPAEQVNGVFGYKKRYNYHGFGTLHSGLKKITEEQYNAIVEIYKEGDNKKLKISHKFYPEGVSPQGGGESDEHKALKEYIAKDPSKALGLEGLKTIKIEYSFPTGDRADIVLEDFEGRLIAVEVEIEQDKDIIGLIQALKYKAMLAPMYERSNSEICAFLVAHKISNRVKKICRNYDVSYFEIDRMMIL